MKLIDIIFETVVDLNEGNFKWTPETMKQKLMDDPKLSNLDFTNSEVEFDKNKHKWIAKNYSCKKHPDWFKESFSTIDSIVRGITGCRICGQESLSKKRQERKKYTKELIRSIAQQYDTKKKFEKGNQQAYKEAVGFGPCYDLTTGEEVRCKLYNKETNSIINRPNTKNSFEFLDNVCSHMKSGGFYGEKFIYSYTFFDDKNDIVGIYVGLTNDEERRKRQHLSPKENEATSAVGKFIKENPNFKYRYKKLTKMVDYNLAKVLEGLYEKKYKSKGYRILNIARTGGGGRTFIPNEYYIEKARKWYNEKIKRGEIPYIADYELYDRANYKAIRHKKLMDVAFEGMLYKDRKKYSNQDIIDIAMSCDSYSDFFKKYNKTVQQQAKRRFMLDDIKQMFRDGLNKKTPNKMTESKLSLIGLLTKNKYL